MELGWGLEAFRGVKKPLALAIGVFDGVHRGHQRVIERCRREAEAIDGASAVLTFHPHPAKVVRPQTAPPLLTTEEQDRELFAKLGVDWCVTLDFGSTVRSLSGREFLEALAAAAATLRTVVVGYQWHFGKDRDGNFDVLTEFASQKGWTAIEVDPVRDEAGGRVISSTWVRELISQGDLDRAERLLGRRYGIRGKIVPGSGVGRQLGFPTANLEAQNELLPPGGVYAVRVRVAGNLYTGALNLGVRPTLPGQKLEKPAAEFHLLDYDADLTGQIADVEFGPRLRPERKFADADELRAQITQDVERVRQWTERAGMVGSSASRANRS